MHKICRQIVCIILLVLLHYLVLVPYAYPAFEDLIIGSRPAALAGAYTGIMAGPEVLFFNPAGLSLNSTFSIATFYSRPFGLKELDISALSFSYKMRHGIIAVAARLFGRNPYQERTLYTSFAVPVTPDLYLGATLKVLNVHIHNYGSASTTGIDLGFMARLSSKICWGVCVKNINRPRIGDYGELLPQRFSTGVSVYPFEQMLISCDLVKDVRFPAEMRIGTNCNVTDILSVQMGIRNNPSRVSFGFRLNLSCAIFDYAVSKHYDLGLTHSVSLSFCFH